MLGHDEMLRGGYAYVGVYTQITGVSASPLALKFWDPIRYAPLHHPGDEYEFDIFSQAARAMATRTGPSPLGDLQAKRIIGAGASQSEALLRTYATHVQNEHKVLDGIDRKRVEYGHSVSVRIDLGGGRRLKKKYEREQAPKSD